MEICQNIPFDWIYFMSLVPCDGARIVRKRRSCEALRHIICLEILVNVDAVLNEHFISIKVDKEERPDIDRIYMNYVQVVTFTRFYSSVMFAGYDWLWWMVMHFFYYRKIYKLTCAGL